MSISPIPADSAVALTHYYATLSSGACVDFWADPGRDNLHRMARDTVRVSYFSTPVNELARVARIRHRTDTGEWITDWEGGLTMSKMTAVPMVNGRCWEWTDAAGWQYQAIALNGRPAVHLYYRRSSRDDWEFGHSREIPVGNGAKGIAESMFHDTTARG